jgi:hypothetical protein
MPTNPNGRTKPTKPKRNSNRSLDNLISGEVKTLTLPLSVLWNLKDLQDNKYLTTGDHGLCEKQMTPEVVETFLWSTYHALRKHKQPVRKVYYRA